jgi:hypothetical protein
MGFNSAFKGLMEVIYENGVVGSNPTRGMDVCPFGVLCVVK